MRWVESASGRYLRFRTASGSFNSSKTRASATARASIYDPLAADCPAGARHCGRQPQRFVVTPRPFILDKGAGEALTIELERQGGRVIVADAT